TPCSKSSAARSRDRKAAKAQRRRKAREVDPGPRLRRSRRREDAKATQSRNSESHRLTQIDTDQGGGRASADRSGWKVQGFNILRICVHLCTSVADSA